MAVAYAREEGLEDTTIANAGLIATEMATNLWKHAKQGEIQVSRLSRQSEPGLDVLAIDRGPGMRSVEECLRDRFSSTGTAGTGLGSLKRISRVFDAYSETAKGTVMLARIGGAPTEQKGMVFGWAGRPIHGEDVSGDAWAIREEGQATWMIVADGLGHGIQAAEASGEAIAAFRKSKDREPADLIRNVHLALRGTRGAAVAVARLDRQARQVHYAGIGNISGIVVSPAKMQYMISHAGTAGHEGGRFQEFVYPYPEKSLLIMHSDGLSTKWTLDAYPGLRFRHPSVIAGTLYRDAARNGDDACVVVAKEQL